MRDALALGQLLPARQLGVEVEDVGVDYECRVRRIVRRREEIGVLHERRLGRPEQPELGRDGSVILGGLDRGDLGIVVGSSLQLVVEAAVCVNVDFGRSDVRHVEQLAAQFALQLVLDEPVQKEREQDADQRADQEERNRDLASKTHPNRR